jgi:hypothetical protein
MRWGIVLSLVLVCSCIAVSAAVADPPWAILSTEVDQYTDAVGYMDRHALQVFESAGYGWSGDLNDVFFDPADLIGADETGLDAFHIKRTDTDTFYYFSTSVDFDYLALPFEDEDLMVYQVSTGLMTSVFDTKALTNLVVPGDYGLDAFCFFYDKREDQDLFVFSTELGGQFTTEEGTAVVTYDFTGGDLLVSDGTEIVGMLDFKEIFGREYGLDALHAWIQDEGPDQQSVRVMMSTEVDGSVLRIKDSPNDPDEWIMFKDQDLLEFSFEYDPGTGEVSNVTHIDLAWQGIEDGFGKDVGLDALYIETTPEPGTVLLVGLGIGALALRLRKKK